MIRYNRVSSYPYGRLSQSHLSVFIFTMSVTKKRKARHFGISDFEGFTATTAPPSIIEMRTLFLRRAGEIYPEVLGFLSEVLFPLFLKIPLFCFEADPRRSSTPFDIHAHHEWAIQNRPSWDLIEATWHRRDQGKRFEIEFEDYWSVPDADRYGYSVPPNLYPKHDQPEIGSFLESMFEWSRSYHLDEPWCREHAFATLDFWAFDRIHQGRGWWPLPYDLLMTYPISINEYSETEFIFKHQTHFPNVGHFADEERKITRLFKSALRDFLLTRVREAQQLGLHETSVKHSQKHFSLLAKFMVGQKSFVELAPHHDEDGTFFGDDTSAVRKAIKSVAETIGLGLPKSRLKPGPKRANGIGDQI